MISIGLVRPKEFANVGGVLRAAGCYGADFVCIEGDRSHKKVRRAPTDTGKYHLHIPTVFTDDLFDSMPVGAVPVAIDLLDDAVSLVDFVHPKNAYYIFGPEDGTLGRAHTSRCAHKVFVPTRYCMNLASTVNVILYDRIAKEQVRKALIAA